MKPRPLLRFPGAALACALILLAGCGLAGCGGDGEEAGVDVDGLAVAPPIDPVRVLPDTGPPAPPPPGVQPLRPDEAPADTLAAKDSIPPGGQPPDTLPAGAGAPAADSAGTWTAGIVDGGGPRQGTATLVGVRTGRHEGYDRVVLEFADGPIPAYHLEYVDRPVRQCGSGAAVPLPGDGWLSIRLDGTRGHDDEGRATVGHGPASPALPNLQRLVFTCDFEAVVELVGAVGSPTPFRAVELTEPARLVVDIRHPGEGGQR